MFADLSYRPHYSILNAFSRLGRRMNDIFINTAAQNVHIAAKLFLQFVK